MTETPAQSPFPRDRPRSERMERQLAQRSKLTACLPIGLTVALDMKRLKIMAGRGTFSYQHDDHTYTVALTVTEQ